MSPRPGLNPRPSTNTKLKTTLKYVVAGGLLATAIFLTIYYQQKQKDGRERERPMVDLSGFKWEKVVVLNHEKISGSEVLFNFPVLLHIQETMLKSKTLGGLIEDIHGYDIAFVDELGEIMDHQVENYDPGSGELLVWVRIQELSPFVDTRFSLYFGNENIKEDLSTNFTWEENYTGVWHLNNDTQDATVNNNTGSSFGTNRVLGKMAYGMQFRGDKDVNGSIVHIPDHNSLDLHKEGTIEAWVYVNSFQNWAGVVYKGDKPDFSDDAYFIQFLGDSERQRLTFGITGENGIYSYERSAIDLKSHTWYYIAFTWNPEKIQLYVNGYDYGSKVNNTAARNTDGGLNIGSQLNEAVKNNPFDGVIDEVRISKVARSQQWIATTYKNQSAPASFFSIDDPQPRLGAISKDRFIKYTFSSNVSELKEIVNEN
ncbi:DUF2341 domain-containing protein [Fulvivirgaceae bacterium BMA12]|uniref:DUF2341 domain-containing protein n=1 Tax=Agaribacillus aureus TaxID=3051825 RepID=A0ABT8L1T4_9BACT|nr:DUF2341 domain-containing protein [Fulvivirgaceae bacterium BMA12]